MKLVQRVAGLCMCIATCGCANFGRQSPENGPVIYAQEGQTVKEAVDSLPAGGGTVILGTGRWSSGYDGSRYINRPNIAILGSGTPAYNSAFTAMTGGTIIQGSLTASTGANYLTIRDLGVDVGSYYINASNGGAPLDGLAIYNAAQTVGAPQVQSPDIENVSCLGYSAMAPFHCMLIENVDSAVVRNVTTVMNMHGFVLKGTNSTVDGVSASGHGIDSIILKSDNYAQTASDEISDVDIHYLITPGDTKGLVIQGVESPITNINIQHVTLKGVSGWGIYIQGAAAQSQASQINVSNVTVDYPGGSPSSDYCMQFVQYVSFVTIDNLACSNMWAGVAPYLPADGAFTHFKIGHSRFSRIATNAIQSYGDWTVTDSSFQTIGGDGIFNTFGVTEVSADTFNAIGGKNLDAAGGTFTVQP